MYIDQYAKKNQELNKFPACVQKNEFPFYLQLSGKLWGHEYSRVKLEEKEM